MDAGGRAMHGAVAESPSSIQDRIQMEAIFNYISEHYPMIWSRFKAICLST